LLSRRASAGDTYLFEHRPNGHVIDQAGRERGLCLSAMKLDGTQVSGGRFQCFRGRTPMRRVGNALVGVSHGNNNSVDYRFAIFEEESTLVDCGAGPTTAIGCS
jgi:hypothetical protein